MQEQPATSSERSSSSALQIDVKEGSSLYQVSSGQDSEDSADVASVDSVTRDLCMESLKRKIKSMESDEEIRKVPEIGAGASGTGQESVSVTQPERVHGSAEGTRRKGKSPADKENKRLKRLLRNRVSAQQARERKKAYLTELEVRVKELEKKNSEVEERLSTLQNENQMLRHILKNTTTGIQERK